MLGRERNGAHVVVAKWRQGNSLAMMRMPSSADASKSFRMSEINPDGADDAKAVRWKDREQGQLTDGNEPTRRAVSSGLTRVEDEETCQRSQEPTILR